MGHGPLVVPPGQPTDASNTISARALRPEVIDDRVVELGDGLVQLDDDQVFVVARFRKDRRVAITRHVLDTVDIRRQQQLGPIGRVELRLSDGTAP